MVEARPHYPNLSCLSSLARRSLDCRDVFLEPSLKHLRPPTPKRGRVSRGCAHTTPNGKPQPGVEPCAPEEEEGKE
jgi:hypothetical protein